MLVKYEQYDKLSSPLMSQFAIAADGIQIWESGKERKPVVCKKYKDFELPYEGRWHNPDIFCDNQWSTSVHSWGTTGTLLPLCNSSDGYKSLIDPVTGYGILCPYDELWVGGYWFGMGPQTNHAAVYFNVLMRPREINTKDLLFLMWKDRCNRPCEDENVIEWPCISKCQLEAIHDQDGESDVTLPDGTVIKRKDLYKGLKERGFKDCIKVCVDSQTVRNNEGAFMDPKNYGVKDPFSPPFDNSFDNLSFELFDSIENGFMYKYCRVYAGNYGNMNTVLGRNRTIDPNDDKEFDVHFFKDNDPAADQNLLADNIKKWSNQWNCAWKRNPGDANTCFIRLNFKDKPRQMIGDEYLFVNFGRKTGTGQYYSKIPDNVVNNLMYLEINITLLLNYFKVLKKNITFVIQAPTQDDQLSPQRTEYSEETIDTSTEESKTNSETPVMDTDAGTTEQGTQTF